MMDRLSKRDFERLGCADMPGPQLRARVFLLEGLVAELELSLREMVDRFAPGDDGQSDSNKTAADRARELLVTVRERYNLPTDAGVPELLTAMQTNFLRCLGVRVEKHESGTQVVFNDRADKAERELLDLKDGLRRLLGI
jgi:hypothetical protein